MARPSKSVALQTRDMSNEERQSRLENEQKLKGNSDNIIAPSYLNEQQKKIFDYIVNELRASNILGNLDIYILATCSIAIDRLQTIETMINNNSELLFDKGLLATKDKYTKDLFRCTNELSLSPSSRSKLANINYQIKQDEQDPLLAILKDSL